MRVGCEPTAPAALLGVSIKVPVLLVYGDQDWAPPAERKGTRSLIPNVRTEIVPNGNHFLSLDHPRELQQLIVGFARN